MITQRPRSFLSDQRGATAVEFALVLVPFFMILFFIVHMGFGLYIKGMLNDAVADVSREITLSQQPGTETAIPDLAQLQDLARAVFKGPNPGALSATAESQSVGTVFTLHYAVDLTFPFLDFQVVDISSNGVLPGVVID